MSDPYSQVHRAIRSGTLRALDGSVPCVDCGVPAECYDHRDYARPLDVEPVCRSCNAKRGPALPAAARTKPVPMSFRLDGETLSLLRALADQQGVHMHDVIRMGARLLAKKHGIELAALRKGAEPTPEEPAPEASPKRKRP